MKALLLSLLLLAYPALASADTKAAFIRSGDLWLLEDGKETRLTRGQKLHSPQWSYDGTRLAYQKEAPDEITKTGTQNEVWTYNLAAKQHQRLFRNGYNVHWAPRDYRLAFQDGGILDVSDGKQFQNVSLGVDTYLWLPDGNDFLLASGASMRPDGWTHAMLYKQRISSLDELAVPFFTIPKELELGETKLIAIAPDALRLSPSKKWLSFIVSPTASWAMDENMLCTISLEGKQFETVAVMAGEGQAAWAPDTDILAYISGSGRIVFGFKNKRLGVKEYPVATMLTPDNYAELSFTWRDSTSVVTSRVREQDWSNDPEKRPQPALYSIDIRTGQQHQLTHPPRGFGDYYPRYIRSMDKLIWTRSSGIGGTGRLWIGSRDGTNAKPWLSDVSDIVFFEH